MYNNAMHASYPHLTPEQREAIVASGGLPIHIEDPETHKLYVLLEQSAAIDDSYIRDELAKGIAEIEAGERVEWDPERVKLEGRRRLAARKNSDQ
jgi:hypothetical protein